MSHTPWTVEVLEAASSSQTIELCISIGQQETGSFSPSKVFALRLLLDEAWNRKGSATGPLGKAVSPQNYNDPLWLQENVDQFVDSVEILDELSAQEEKEGYAILRIETTDPQWTEHLDKYMSWESVAHAL